MDRSTDMIQALNSQLLHWLQQKLAVSSSADLKDGLVEYLRQVAALGGDEGRFAGLENGEILSQIVQTSPFVLFPTERSKVVHFIRHGHGFHNYPINSENLDPHLTEIGWQQTVQLKKHILDLKWPLDVEVVISSSMTRALETTVGVFGCGTPGALHEKLMVENETGINGVRPKCKAFYKERGLRVIANELCREQLLGHNCDKRRTCEELKQQFPGVDFSGIDHNHDFIFEQRHEDMEGKVRERANEFLQWLMGRREQSIVVVSHCNFLLMLTDECCKQLQGSLRRSCIKPFGNCELRSFVLNNFTPLTPQLNTWFHPTIHPVTSV